MSSPVTADSSVVPDLHVYPSGWFEFAPTIESHHRSKLVRELSLVKGPTPAPWPSNRLPRPHTVPKSPNLDEFRKVAAKGMGDREHGAIGKAVGPDYVIETTNGHVAILRPGTSTEKGHYNSLFVPPDAPRQIVIDADFWAAYSRVRTCRRPLRVPSEGAAVRIVQGSYGDVVRLEAGNLDVDGWDAREWVRDIPEAPRTTPYDPFEIIVNDRYVWPLRGLTGVVRQAADRGVMWWQLDGQPPVLMMPMNP